MNTSIAVTTNGPKVTAVMSQRSDNGMAMVMMDLTIAQATMVANDLIVARHKAQAWIDSQNPPVYPQQPYPEQGKKDCCDQCDSEP